MPRRLLPLRLMAALAMTGAGSVPAAPPGNLVRQDARLKEITYDSQVVVTVPVQRGVVTHILLDDREAMTDVASGLGAECNKPEATWCIAAQAGSHHLFVKPKSNATGPNNLAVVTTQRTHAFRFVVLPPGDSRQPVYRLVVKPPPARQAATSTPGSAPPPNGASVDLAKLLAAAQPGADEVVNQRLAAGPTPMNWQYSLAEGAQSQHIVPTLIFDDGRFTYLRFPNNREIPAVFHVIGDGTESLVNVRMEEDLLVVDRVSRRLMLRAGSAVVGIWNEAFDLDGVPPEDGTTVDGVRRVLRATQAPAERSRR